MGITKSALRRRYNRDLALYERANEDLKRLLSRLMEDLSDRYRLRPAAITGEMKAFDDLYEKALAKETKGEVHTTDDCFQKIRDIARARVICQTLSDCDRLHQLLSENPTVFVKEPETEIWDPSPNGYRGIHLSVDVYVNVKGEDLPVTCELQILTGLQNCWTLYTHKEFYKGQGAPALVQDLMRQLSDLLRVADGYADRLIRALEEP